MGDLVHLRPRVQLVARNGDDEDARVRQRGSAGRVLLLLGLACMVKPTVVFDVEFRVGPKQVATACSAHVPSARVLRDAHRVVQRRLRESVSAEASWKAAEYG